MNEELTLKDLIAFCERRMEECKTDHGYYKEIKMTLEEIVDRNARNTN